MPYKREYFDAELILEHRGVSVYAGYEADEDIDPTPMAYWYVLAPGDCIEDDSGFDIRDVDLSGLPLSPERQGDHAAILRHAIEGGQITANGKRPS
ncbi:MAG TPA: hypothetical protein VNL71_02195 [Chloroflexota bacterium]|nr:hypothetical protein [Chloroflexota bacterium]